MRATCLSGYGTSVLVEFDPMSNHVGCEPVSRHIKQSIAQLKGVKYDYDRRKKEAWEATEEYIASHLNL